MMPFNFLLSVKVKNAGKAKEIEGVVRAKAAGEVQWSQFQHGDTVIHALSEARLGGVPTFAYVLSENTFLLASSPEMAKASLDASSRGDGMYAHEAVASGLSRLPKSASAIMLVDYGAYFQFLADAMREPVPADLKGLPVPPTVVALVEDPARLSFVSHAPRGYGWSESLVGIIEKALDEALAQQERRDWQRQPGQ
jgi:hypothetical protein